MPSLAEGYLSEQDGAKAEADPAFHLRTDDIRIDGHPAVDGTPDFVHARQPILVRYLGNLRDVGIEALVHGDAARASFGNCGSRHFGNPPEDAAVARECAEHGET